MCAICKDYLVAPSLFAWISPASDWEKEGMLCGACAKAHDAECLNCEAAKDNGHPACSAHYGEAIDRAMGSYER